MKCEKPGTAKEVINIVKNIFFMAEIFIPVNLCGSTQDRVVVDCLSKGKSFQQKVLVIHWKEAYFRFSQAGAKDTSRGICVKFF